MAYRAEIQIGVVGIGQLGTLQKSLNQVATTVDILNKKRIDAGFNVQNINTYNAALQKAWQNINKAAMGSKEELQAVKDLVIAKNNQIAAQQRLNTLIAKEQSLQQQIIPTRDAGFGLQGPKPPPRPAGGLGGGGGAGGLGFNPQASAENLALGAGFPLLFGGGVGQVAGGLAGSFFGQGFGGQILGSAIGQQLEDALRRVTEIAAATKTLNLDALRESTIAVNAELQLTVDRLREAGQGDAARAEIAREVALQTGLLPEETTAVSQSVSALSTAWNEVVGAVSGLLSIIGKPFVTALAVILQGIAKAAQGVNIILQLLLKFSPVLAPINALWTAIANVLPVINEQQEQQYVSAVKLTDQLNKELMQKTQLIKLESQRTLGRTVAEQQINAAIDSQIAKEQIRTNYAEKQKELRKQLAETTDADARKQIELAIQQTAALEQQELKQQRIKDLLTQQRFEIEANTQKYNEAAEAVNRQIASLERGAQVTQSRYTAEAALNDLYGAQLQRQYELATTEQQRFNIALRMFEQQVRAAQIEYDQALNNNVLLVEKAKLEANLVQLKYQQLEAEKAIAIAQAQSRGNTPEQIKSIAEAYDKGLGLQQEALQTAYDQVQATIEIANNQNIVADAVYKTKIVQAESQLAQKLVSEEIGLSQQQADRLAGSLSAGVFRANEMSSAMYNVAQQAANAAQQIQNAINLQNMLRGGGDQNAAPQQAANGAYWPGGFKAFANGGVVSKPTLGLVGEGGEPEYIIPASKMDEAMSRYAQGQRGSSVIPSSINPQVNVTTGPVMNMNGSNYVSQNDFLAGMQTASRRGAEMALQALQGSNSVRRAVGVG